MDPPPIPRPERTLLVGSVLAWGLCLGLLNLLRTYTFQAHVPQDLAAVQQLLASLGDGLGFFVTASPQERGSLADRSHFTPILAVLAPLFRVLPDGASLVLYPVLHMSAAIAVFRMALRLTGRRALAWLAAAALCIHPVTVRACLDGLHESLLAAPLSLWALDAALSGAIGRFAWLALATLACREDAALLVAGSAPALLVLGQGGVWRRARIAALSIGLAGGYLLGIGLFRAQLSDFVDASWFDGEAGAFSWLVPNGPGEAPPPVQRAALDARLSVVEALFVPALLPSVLAPELAIAAAPVWWGAVFAYPTGPRDRDELRAGRGEYHLAEPAGFLILAAVVGIWRVLRRSPRPIRHALPLVAGAALGALWVSPQGLGGADPWDRIATADDALPCYREFRIPPITPTLSGLLARFAGPAVGACWDAIASVHTLARRVPDRAVVVAENGWVTALAARTTVYSAAGLADWRPRFVDEAEWALLDPATPRSLLPGRWVIVEEHAHASLLRRVER